MFFVLTTFATGKNTDVCGALSVISTRAGNKIFPEITLSKNVFPR